MIGAFERPIVLFVGLGFPRQVNNPLEAVQVLEEMPARYNVPAHAAAIKACRAAIAGEIEPDTARGSVEAYAKARGMLVEDGVAPFMLSVREDLLGA